MSSNDMGVETLEVPVAVEKHIDKPQSFDRELGEVLKPSKEVIQHSGLDLINTMIWLDQLGKKYGRNMTVDTVPDNEWERMFERYDSFWFMGIYKRSPASREHAKKYADQYKPAKPDLDLNEDISGSPYAIPEYSPDPSIASSWEKWDRMTEKLNSRGKKVFVDFVPNHVAIDHPWAVNHPEYFIQGNEAQYAANPNRYQEVTAADGKKHYLAHGKDPNFSEWSDTLQLNYANPLVREEMEKILLNLAEHSNGVRCDMAMLLNPDTFLRTWGDHLTDSEKAYISDSKNKFWENVIPKVKEKALKSGKDDFTFIAEAYWDEKELGKNFDYIYYKKYYDHLIRIIKDGEPAGMNLQSHIDFLMNTNQKALLFTENHDESRAVAAFGGKEQSKAAATLTAFFPKSIFLLQLGQTEGEEVRIPVQLRRFLNKEPDKNIQKFYDRLLALKHSRLAQEGKWTLARLDSKNANMVAIKVTSKDSSGKDIGAVICVNTGGVTGEARIPQVTSEKEARVFDLSKGKDIKDPDVERKGGIYIKIDPYGSQVVYFSDNNSKFSTKL